MKFFINILVSLALLFWPILYLTSFMLFDAPNSTQSKSNIIFAILVISYPIYIFAIYYFLNINFFIFKPKIMLLIASVIVGLSLINHFSMLNNARKGVKSFGYTVTSSGVFFNGKKISENSNSTFEILDDDYARDSQKIYYKGKVILDSPSDVLNFKMVNSHSFTKSKYYKTDKFVFYEGEIIESADPVTFKLLDRVAMAQDEHHIYYLGERHPADVHSFKILNTSYFKDINALYYLNLIVQDPVDILSFRLLYLNPQLNLDSLSQIDQYQILTDLAQDKNQLYALIGQFVIPFPSADPLRFRFSPSKINGVTSQTNFRNYYQDKNHVFYLDSNSKKIILLDGVLIQNFYVTNYDDKTNSDANDGEHFYLNGQLTTP